MMNLISSFGAGFGLSLSLNSAIGVQNIILMRQGLQRRYVGRLVVFCTAVDAVLMTLGVGGLGTLLAALPLFKMVLSYSGALFLAVYGLLSLRKMLSEQEVDFGAASSVSARRVLMTMAGVTLLNPHVYVDTMLLVGTTGAAQPRALHSVFTVGAVSGSAAWFALLGYGVRWLRPWLARPMLWRILDGFTGLLMIGLAVSLVIHAQ
ncbi:LysE/ArgO family amino acid transporter [Saccharibacter floricola]|uniref:Lysine/threonine exporter protein LysE n=1 Tax=Saccharibacter floricola DSM 15669 TaxID=1123227 RepID=A0ABQ0NYY7_9PROT|nr:LysE family transporter [Saccharibacter floricola]GBQ06977.1 lysine/threonine exporter protein LysE [Saccharibacter floricola DSM 15669]